MGSSMAAALVKEGVEVTEDLPLEPLTDYSRFKAECEALLDQEKSPGFTTVTIRPATVCGYSPRMRFDTVFNDLVATAVTSGRVVVHSDGKPWRPVKKLRS